MLFRRRDYPHPLIRLRQAAWPPQSWSRSARYLAKRVIRLSASPHAIAAGVAAGAFASFTPFIGFHFLIGFALAFVLGGNLLAAAIGTAVGNPLTFPLIWAATFKLGHFVLGGAGRVLESGEISRNLAEESLAAILPLVRTMMVGAVPLGLATALVLYVVVHYSVREFQTLRRDRLAVRRRERAGQPQPVPARRIAPK
jgi:uncharacterized protein (DUF2062 family)